MRGYLGLTECAGRDPHCGKAHNFFDMMPGWSGPLNVGPVAYTLDLLENMRIHRVFRV